MRKKVLGLVLGLFTSSLLVGCGVSTDVAPLVSLDGNSSTNFKVLDGEAAKTRGHDMLKEKNPELAAALEGLKDLSPEERKAKMEELKTQFPELAKKPPMGMGKGGKFKHHNQKGNMRPGKIGPGMPFGNLEKDNPEFAADMKALREEQQQKVKEVIAKYPDIQQKLDERKAKMEEMNADRLAKLKEKNPELAAALEGLKDLSPEERKVKMEELKTQFPNFSNKEHKKMPLPRK